MLQMQVEQMFEDGNYMVIYISNEVLTKDDLGRFLWELDASDRNFCPLDEAIEGTSQYQDILNRWKSLIVVTGSPYRESKQTEEFAATVRMYNKKRPFFFPGKSFRYVY